MNKKVMKWIRKEITFTITPVPGWDSCDVIFYFQGKKIGEKRLDGVELEMIKKGK